MNGHPDGDIAWFYAMLTLDGTAGHESFTMPMRVTGVATQDAGHWRFRQTHFSLAASDQDEWPILHRCAMSTTRQIVERLKAMYASGDHAPCSDLYADDAIFDVNLPEWRFQLQGPDAIRHQLDTWHPRVPALVEWHQRETDWGAVVELGLWEGEDYELYSRSGHILDIIAGRIDRHVMYCIGDMTKDVYERSMAHLINSGHRTPTENGPSTGHKEGP